MSRTSRRLSDLIRNVERPIPVLENTGDGNTAQFETDDFKPEYIQRMASHLVAVTTETANEFPISTVQAAFGVQDGRGNPAALGDPGANNQENYASKFTNPSPDGRSALSEFQNTSNPGFLNTNESRGGKFVIKKGKSNVDAPTGTEILQEVNEKGEEAGFVQRLRQVQFDNNRFTVGKTFVPRSGEDGKIPVDTPGSSGPGSVREDDSNIGVGYAQQEFGKHGPRKFPTVEGQTATLITLRNLKKIGLLTMLQASGEYYVPTDPNDIAQQLAARGASLAPGLARIGQKIDMIRISPIKIMKDVDPAYQKPNLDDNIKKDAVLSYGSVNNYMAPFAGLNSTASVAGAALLTLTIGALLKGAALLLSPRQRPSRPLAEPNAPKKDRRKRLGSYLGKASEMATYRNTEMDIDVTQTTHDYFQCVSKGIDIFFGVTVPGLQAKKVVENHGYYNTVLRSLVRNTTDFIKIAAGGIVNPEGVRDINDVTILGNPLGATEMLQKLNSSQLLKFCNIMATLGDVALSHEASGFVIDQDGELDDWISDIDRLVAEADVGPNRESTLNPGVLQSLDRLPGKYRNALAWGSNTVKSMYMFPESLFRGEARFTGAQDQSQSPTESVIADLSSNGLHKTKGPNELTGPRISAEDVQSMEEYLEADYMPFYFHDIRTNEIIAFHAFLEEVNDGFDAEYTEVEGYGRIGKVMIYKNTNRTISLGFRVVATNEKDFDHMWWKINKLVTLVYPQYTEGRQVGTATDKFVQPFSQVPSASPLIRLRLGDVFKSNYSKFAVARLFGVGSGQFSLQGADGTFRYNASLVRAREQVATRMGQGDFNVGEYANLTPLFVHGNRGAGQRLVGYPRVGNLVDTASQPGQSTRRGRGGARGAGSVAQQAFITLSANGPPSNFNSIGRPLMVQQLLKVQISSVREVDGTKVYTFSVPNGGVDQDGLYTASQYNLQPDPSEVTRIAFNQTTPSTSDTPTNTPGAITTFFDSAGDNGNPIIKSFESTKGRGLAGFIKTMRFDWNDSRWETGRQNARAPMSLKVNIDFAPIHDINPGLDSDGFMTAPVYNTGDTVRAFTEMPDQRNQNNTDRSNMYRSLLNALPRTSNGNQSGG